MLPHETETRLPFQGVRLVTVCQMFNASPATVWRWVKTNPGFPQPIKLSAAVTAWDEAELIQWLDAKKAARKTRNDTARAGDFS